MSSALASSSAFLPTIWISPRTPLVGMVGRYFDADPLNDPQVPEIMAQVATLAGILGIGWFARDDDVSSEGHSAPKAAQARG